MRRVRVWASIVLVVLAAFNAVTFWLAYRHVSNRDVHVSELSPNEQQRLFTDRFAALGYVWGRGQGARTCFVGRDGLAVTTAHVVEGQTTVPMWYRRADGAATTGTAQVLRCDADRDVAVLRVSSEAGRNSGSLEPITRPFPYDDYTMYVPDDLNTSHAMYSLTIHCSDMGGERDHLYLDCAGEPSWAGSPVIDQKGRLVAIC